VNTGVLYLLALLAGACITIQPGVNSQLQLTWAKSLILAAFINFLVGASCFLICLLVTRTPVPPLPAKFVPWHWTGGILGAAIVSASLYAAPRLGAVALIGLLLAGQVGVSLILDHFGLLGYAQKSITWQRMLGAVLVGSGVFLIRRF
jgi:transporter family-2 protein